MTHRIRTSVVAMLLAAATTVGLAAACGFGVNAARGTGTNATSVAATELANRASSSPDTVSVPDLTDPATRKQFVCSFEDGYFTEPQARSNSSSSYCR
jgi:hypothetical protein